MSRRPLAAIALSALVAGSLAGAALARDPGAAGLSGTLSADGSSTLGPLTAAVADAFAASAPGVEVALGANGTARGFERFCAGETDLQGASRPMTAEESAACDGAGVRHVAFDVALDGITVVVNDNATFINCLNLAALRLVWQADDPVREWSDLNPAWPARQIAPYAPGPDSGTRDAFAAEVLDGGPIRDDALPAEDDAILVEGVANEANGIAFLGYAWYDDNRDTLSAVKVDGGAGCVEPSAASIRNGTYAPLSRPLTLYVNEASLGRPEVREFLRFYLERAEGISADAGLVPAPSEAYAEGSAALERAIAGLAAAATPES